MSNSVEMIYKNGVTVRATAEKAATLGDDFVPVGARKTTARKAPVDKAAAASKTTEA